MSGAQEAITHDNVPYRCQSCPPHSPSRPRQITPAASLYVEVVVDRHRDLLPAAKICLCGLDRGMTQQKLNLLELTSLLPTQPRAGAPHIMGAEMLDADCLRRGDNDIPHCPAAEFSWQQAVALRQPA